MGVAPSILFLQNFDNDTYRYVKISPITILLQGRDIMTSAPWR